MDIKRLESFCRVYELQSFSRAASDLLLSQPTISAHIAALEDELDVALFDRLGRAVLPTQAGNILYRHARQLIDDLAKAIAEIHFLKGRVSGTLLLGGSTIPAHYFLPEIMHRFQSGHPDVRLHLEIGDSAEVAGLVGEGRLDLGVIGARPEDPELDYRFVMRDELVLIGPDLFLRDIGPETGSGALAELPWILREKGSGTRKALERGLERQGMRVEDLRVAAVVHGTEAVLQCVRAGMGVSVTSRLAADSLPGAQVAVTTLSGLQLQRSFYAVYHRHRTMFPAGQAFLGTLTSSGPCREDTGEASGQTLSSSSGSGTTDKPRGNAARSKQGRETDRL
jgi:DNA-binding transcriptional LysR family regulator